MRNIDKLKELQDKITFAYKSEYFKEQGYKMVDMLARYLNETQILNKEKMFPAKSPQEIEQELKCDFKEASNCDFTDIAKELMQDIMPVHHPHYLGHQVSSPLPAGALADMMMSLLNNSDSTFEMGPSAAGAEKAVIDWMCKKIGYTKNFAGVLTSGGTLGNFTALLAARQSKAGYDIWSEGVKCDKQLSVLVSEQAHYSVKRAISVMGLGDNGAVSVPCDENYQMSVSELKRVWEKSTAEGKNVFAVVADACSTATGTYDNLKEIAAFCKKNNLWLHVDGAHGAPALLSKKYKHLLSGIEHADSVVWDGHKMMMLPSVVTGVLFKDANASRHAFSQHAAYIFDGDFNWFDYGLRTMECTKPFISLKMYSNLKLYGEKFFGNYIDYMYDLTKEFADLIEKSEDFELATSVQSNIICFRYLAENNTDLNELQVKIREKLLSQQNFYIVKTELRGKTYLRCTVINPHSAMSHLCELLENIRKIAAAF